MSTLDLRYRPSILDVHIRSDQELTDFLFEVEEAILELQRSSDAATEDLGGILLQSKLLLRDIVMVEGLLHPPGSDVIIQAVADVRAIQSHVDDGYRRHDTGRPQILISEEQLVIFPMLTWQKSYRFPPKQ